MAYDKTKKEKKGGKLFRETRTRPFNKLRGPQNRAARFDVPAGTGVTAPTLIDVINEKPVGVGWANVSALRKPCSLSLRAGTWREGKAELMWAGPDAVRRHEARTGLKLPAGPVLRLCTASNQPGVLVPVRDVNDAAQLARQHRSCVVETKDVKACAAAAAGRPGAALGGLRPRGGRRSPELPVQHIMRAGTGKPVPWGNARALCDRRIEVRIQPGREGRDWVACPACEARVGRGLR